MTMTPENPEIADPKYLIPKYLIPKYLSPKYLIQRYLTPSRRSEVAFHRSDAQQEPPR